MTAACALLCTGGTIIGRLWPRNDDEKRAALDAGYDLDRILTTTDLVSGEEVFFAATGISDFLLFGWIKNMDLQIVKVPYRDIVQAATDLAEGRLQVMMSSYAILQPRVQAGSVKVLAVNGHQRASVLPDIPTASESGFPALEVEGLVGLFGPRNIGKDLRERIGADVAAVAGDPAIAERLIASAQVPNPGGPAALAEAVDHQRAQIADRCIHVLI